MALIKDGEIYRTYEEEVDHLAEKHREQIEINLDVNKSIQDLGIASNLGGYNLVRFSFSSSGTFYKLSQTVFYTGLHGNAGDYAELTSGNQDDIPAYGYYNDENQVVISYFGDFAQSYPTLKLRNVTQNTEMAVITAMVEFQGTSLLDYNPNERKKQLFNVLQDLTYNTSTQYVSFDLNNDGIYNFVFVGANHNGVDGRSVLATNGTDFTSVLSAMKLNDLLLIADLQTDIPLIPTAKIGDIWLLLTSTTFELKGNIRGDTGQTGAVGQTGEQGIQGATGAIGAQGAKGDKGDKGDTGDAGLVIHTGTYNSAAELPPFDTAVVGDAYRVLNTTQTITSTDLYFKAAGGTTWDIQTNWGGTKGDKGDKGDIGLTGAQGIQGLQGVQGIQGETGATGATGAQGVAGVTPKLYSHTIKIYSLDAVSLKDFVEVSFTVLNQSNVLYTKDNFFSRLATSRHTLTGAFISDYEKIFAVAVSIEITNNYMTIRGVSGRTPVSILSNNATIYPTNSGLSIGDTLIEIF